MCLHVGKITLRALIAYSKSRDSEIKLLHACNVNELEQIQDITIEIFTTRLYY
jgi:hypothetical protein